MISQFDIFDRSDLKKFEKSKIQDGGGRHLETSKNHHISAAVKMISTKFSTLMQFDLLDR